MNKYKIILIKVRFDGRKEEVLNTETSDYLTEKDLIKAIKEKGLRNRGKFVELRIFDDSFYYTTYEDGIGDDYRIDLVYKDIIEKYVCGGGGG